MAKNGNGKLNIAMIGHKRIPSREGGIEIVVEELSKRLVKLGHSVTAYNRKGSNVAGDRFETAKNIKEFEGVKIVSVPTPQNKTLNAVVYSFFAALSACFKRYDVVHFHAEGPSAMCFLPKLFGRRVVVTIHGLDWARSKWGGFATKYLLFGEKTAAKHADEIIVLSKAVQNYFKETYNRNTVYIPNGISRPEIREPKLIEEKFGLKKNGYILYLGRIVPEKGAHYLIDAYKGVKTQMPLVIAGGSSHTAEYFNEVKKQAEGSNVIFTDFVDGELLDEIYSNAYVYVLPSDLEGMPMSLLEAMSYGNCCLTSDIAECTEVVEDKAVTFKAGDVQNLREKLQQLLDSPETVEKYKQSASDFICTKFSWDKTVNDTVKLYVKR